MDEFGDDEDITWEWSMVYGPSSAYLRAHDILHGDIENVLYVLKSVRGFGETFDEVISNAMEKLSNLSQEEENRTRLVNEEGFRTVLDVMEIRLDSLHVQELCVDIIQNVFHSNLKLNNSLKEHIPSLLAVCWDSLEKYTDSEALSKAATQMFLAIMKREQAGEIQSGVVSLSASFDDGRGVKLLLSVVYIHRQTEDILYNVCAVIHGLTVDGSCNAMLMDFGAIKAVLEIAKTRRTNYKLSSEVIGALRILTDSALVALEVMSLGGINFATSMIQLHPNTPVTDPAANTLYNITKVTQTHNEITIVDIIQAFLSVLRSSAQDAELTMISLAGLANTCVTLDGKRILNREGGVQFCIHSVIRFKKHPGVQAEGLRLMESVSGDSKPNCEVLVNEGAVKMLFELLGSQFTKIEMKIAALKTLKAMFAGWAGSVDSAIQQKAVDTFIELMQNTEIQVAELSLGCLMLVIERMVDDEVYRKELKYEYIIHLLIKEVIKYKENAYLQSKVLVLLRIVVAESTESSNFQVYPTLDSFSKEMIETMIEFSSVPQMQVASCLLLRELVLASPDIAENLAVSAGEMLIVVLQLHAKNADVIDAATQALAAFTIWKIPRAMIAQMPNLEKVGKFLLDSNMQDPVISGRVSLVLGKILADVGTREDADCKELLIRFHSVLSLHGMHPQACVLGTEAVVCVTHSEKNQIHAVQIGLAGPIILAMTTQMDKTDLLASAVEAFAQIAASPTNAPAILMQEGLVPVFTNIVKTFANDPKLYSKICMGIESLSKLSSEMNSHIADRMLSSLIMGIKQNVTDVACVKASFQCLSTISTVSENIRYEITRQDIVGVVEYVFSLYPDDIIVIGSCFKFLGALSMDVDCAVAIFNRKLMVSTAFMKIRAFIADAVIQQHAMDFLNNASKHQEIRSEVLSRGGFPAISKTLNFYLFPEQNDKDDLTVTPLHKKCATSACQAMSSIICEEEGMSTATHSTCLDDIINAIRKFGNDGTLTAALLVTFANLCSAEANAHLSVQKMMLPTLFDTIRDHFMDVELIKGALRAVYNLTFHKKYAHAFHVIGGTKLTIQVACAHSTHSEVFGACLLVLLNLSFIGAATLSTMMKQQSISIIANALKYFSREVTLRATGFAVLRNMASESASHDDIFATGILTVISTVLRERNSGVQLCTTVLGLTANLTSGGVNLQQFVEEGVLASVIEVLKNTGNDKLLVENGLMCFRNMFRFASLHRQQQAEGSLPLILSCMKKNQTHPGILELGASALYLACRESDAVRTELLRAGLAECLVNALVVAASERDRVITIVDTMLALGQLSQAADTMSSQGVGRAVELCLSKHFDHEEAASKLLQLVVTVTRTTVRNVRAKSASSKSSRLVASNDTYTRVVPVHRWTAVDFYQMVDISDPTNNSAKDPDSRPSTGGTLAPLNVTRGSGGLTAVSSLNATAQGTSRPTTEWNRPDTANSTQSAGGGRPLTATTMSSDVLGKLPWIHPPKTAGERDASRQRLTRTGTNWNSLFKTTAKSMATGNLETIRMGWQLLALMIPQAIVEEDLIVSIPTTFIQTLDKFVNDAKTLEYSLEVLCYFGNSQECQEEFISAPTNPIPTLIQIGWVHIASAVITGRCMQLSSLITQHEDVCRAFRDADGEKLVAKALLMHPFANQVSTSASAILANLSFMDGIMTDLAGLTNTKDTTISALLRVAMDHLEDAAAQSSTMATLHLASRDSIPAQFELVRLKGIGYTLTSMRMHRTDVSVQELGSKLIANVLYLPLAAKEAIRQDIIGVLMDAIITHISKISVISAAIRALGILADMTDGEYKPLMVEENVALIAVGTLVEFRLQNREVNLTSLSCLNSLLPVHPASLNGFPDGIRAIAFITCVASGLEPLFALKKIQKGESSALGSEVKITRLHDRPLQILGCVALSHIARENEVAAEIFANAGVVRMLMCISKIYSSEPDIMAPIFDTLASITAYDEAVAQMTKEQGVDVVIIGLKLYFQDKLMLSNIAITMKNSLRNSQDQARFCRGNGVPMLMTAIKNSLRERKILLEFILAMRNLAADQWSRKILNKHDVMQLITTISTAIPMYKALEEAINETKDILKSNKI